ncbi:uncharacterized protein PG986_007232 [Apiospora aurea]|uniref:C2H2-type domain-containing protein n=1 Tax=Apiospora aurea TaxID=335848 RepID=A0ABR1QBZ7_9PEZI
MEGVVSTSAPEAPMHDAPLLSPSPVQPQESHSTFATVPNGAARGDGPGFVMGEPDAVITGAATPQPPSAQPQPPSASSSSSASAPASAPAPAPAPSKLFTPASTPGVTPGPPSASLPPRTSPLAAQPPPAQYDRRTSMPQGGKVPIVEPPGVGLRRAASQTPNAFQSPGRDHGRENPKFNDDLSRLTHAVQQSVPEAVRRVTRDNWEKILLGTGFHQAFIMNAIIHHANGDILRRGIREFGRKMVSESHDAIISHFGPADLDSVADAILDKASDAFLDKALERRLATIDARSLIDALARAERLGYESNDVNGDNGTTASPPVQTPTIQGNHSYQFQQQAQQQMPHQEFARSSPTSLMPPAPPPKQQSSLQCPLCWRKFAAAPPYEFHVKKQLCTKTPPNSDGFPFNCSECGAGFVTAVGQKSHYLNRVCGAHGFAPATPKAPPAPASSPAMQVATPMYVQQPASQMQQQSPYSQRGQPQPPWSTPVPKQNSETPGASAPPSSSGAVATDPYAHLNPGTRARLDQDLLAAEAAYAPRFKEAEMIADPDERKLKLEGLQNSFSTKQSIIRKKYGVRLRQRRTKEEIEAERIRLTGHTGTPGGKRQRVDDGLGDTPSYVPSQQTPQLPATPSVNNPAFTPTKHLSVTDMNSSGLGGSSATAATADPTTNVQQYHQTSPNPPPRNSLAVYQRNGYRVDRHVSRSVPQSPVQSPIQVSPAQASPAPANNPNATAEAAADAPARGPSFTAIRSSSAAAPLVLDDDDPSSDSDSDGDGEIPAKLPPGSRPNGPSSRGWVG